MNDPICLEGVEFFDHMIEVADGVSLRVLEWRPVSRSETAVVFVAGMVTVVDSWVPVLRELAENRRVIYVETREKRSAAIAPVLMRKTTFALSKLGGDLAAVCRSLGIDGENSVFIGSSLGANAILEGLKRGLECRAAFLIGPNIEFYVPWWGHVLLRCPSWAYRAVLPPVIWYLRRFRLDPASEPEQAARYERALVEACPDRLKLTLRELARYRGGDGLGAVRVPVAVAFAPTDALHGEDNVRRLVAGLSAGEAIECSSNAAMHSPAILKQLDRFVRGA